MWPGKKIVYVDMDHVLCDYQSAYDQALAEHPEIEYPQSVEGFFSNLKPIPGAIEAYAWLTAHPLIKPLILTAPSVMNPHCYQEKRLWVEQYIGFDAVRDLIITPHKHLNFGDYLIDDQVQGRGQEWFQGELIQFGSKAFRTWQDVTDYLMIQLR